MGLRARDAYDRQVAALKKGQTGVWPYVFLRSNRKRILGKPAERQGRKAMGLRARDAYDRQVAALKKGQTGVCP